MTNAEKFLKDGADGIKPLLDKCREIGAIDSGREYRIYQMLREEVKPTLTEDERIILRNIDIDNYKGIGRKNDTLYLVSTIPNYFGGENDKEVFWYCFHELFQFIKERRRIRDKGVIGRKMTEHYIKYYKRQPREFCVL